MTQPLLPPDQIEELADKCSSWFTAAGSKSPERMLDHRAFAQCLFSALEDKQRAAQVPFSDTVTVPRAALEYVLKGAEDVRARHLPDLVVIRDALANTSIPREPDGWILTNILLTKGNAQVYLRATPGDAEAVAVIRMQQHKGQPMYAVREFYFDQVSEKGVSQ